MKANLSRIRKDLENLPASMQPPGRGLPAFLLLPKTGEPGITWPDN